MSERTDKLSLFDAVGMAIGGMVGGGIFAVLGQAAHTAGNAAFISFGLAGALALVTGASYGRLTTDYDEPGGSFSYVEHLAGPRRAGTLSWFLIAGYLFTNALYAYTFGAYAVRLFGGPDEAVPFVGAGIVVALAGVNLAGVRASGLAEDLMVYGKVAFLVVLGLAGFLAVRPAEALPVIEGAPTDVLSAAALIFVGFEGFQLLTYDYDDIEDHRRNLPRAMRISILVVIGLYVLIAFVTTGAVPDAEIAARRETVLAEVAQPVLGRLGLTLVLVAAVLSTASAINATIFANGRLAKRVAADRQLPGILTRIELGGVPLIYLSAVVGLSITLLFTANLRQIVSFSSLVFLAVFAVVNVAALIEGAYSGWRRVWPLAGALGCLTAIGVLVRHLWEADPGALRAIGLITLVLLALRLIYDLYHREYMTRRSRGRDESGAGARGR